MFETPSQNHPKIANYENTQNFKTSKSNLFNAQSKKKGKHDRNYNPKNVILTI